MSVLAQTHIVATPGTCFGKPRIDGRRVRVEDVAYWHIHQSMSVQEIAQAHRLTMAEVHAALAYYFDHRDEIEADITEGAREVQRARGENPSLVRKHLQGE